MKTRSSSKLSDSDMEQGIPEQTTPPHVSNTRRHKIASPLRAAWSGLAAGAENLSSLQSDTAADETDLAALYVCGFVIGWFTWVFGMSFGMFAGRGCRAFALRKGLFVGASAVTIPLLLIVALFALVIVTFKELLDKLKIFR